MSSIWTFLTTFGPWAWMVLAVALFALETIVPGVHFLWFGLAAVVVGVLAMATGMSLPAQLVAFALVSIVTVFWVRRYARPEAVQSDVPDLNARGAQYVGRTVVLEEGIRGGRGKARIGDTIWPVAGADAPAGTRVTVVGADGVVLKVEAVG